jgi:hypothetical protein
VSAFQRKLEVSGQGRPALIQASKTLELKPEHFSSTWHARPTEPVLVGLRITSERDREGASIEALRSINERKLTDEEQDRCIESVYARIIAARGICDPNNVLAAHPLLPLPDDQIARAFPTSTIRWLFDELHVLNISQSPSYSEATPEEVAKLCDILTLDSDPIAELEPKRAALVRRLLWAVLTEFE